MTFMQFVVKMPRAPGALFRRAAALLFPVWYNKKFCATDELWSDYFAGVEQLMDTQWENTIWPVIRNFDFDTVLELAPGAGRNTEHLAKISRVIHAVDMNEYALRQLRLRFQEINATCELFVHQNHGSDLAMIADASITFIYSWDAAVHFDKAVLKSYIREFARVLKPKGTGFVHHSNLGKKAHADIGRNIHWRSNMSKELFAQWCKENNLEIITQIDLPWTGPPGMVVDCISVFRKD